MGRMGRIWRIAKLGLWLGATVFGGVAAAYPRVRERASELGEITGEEVDGIYALAVLLPGPSFLNLVGAVSGRAGDHTRLLAPVGIMLLVMVGRMLKAPTAALMVTGITSGMLVQGTRLAGW